MSRYLDKSRFALAIECPAKLFYTGKEEYPNQKIDDAFLEALARGGFQIGTLAKCYFPGGIEVEELDLEDAVNRTNDLLAEENVTIFEAAVRFEDFFIRVDVLVKRGDLLDLIEVKAKSWSDAEDKFVGRDGVMSDWKPYLYDVAFQKFVVQGAFPDAAVSAFLMLTNKDTVCPTDGLNQKFRVKTNEGGRNYVEIRGELTVEERDNPILRKISVDDVCELIFDDTDQKVPTGRPFAVRAREYADHYVRDEQIVTAISKVCKACEFRTTAEDRADGKLDGYRQCWRSNLGWGEADFDSPTVLEVWNLAKDKFLSAGKVKLSDLMKDDIGPEDEYSQTGLSRKQRQWIQVEKAATNDRTPFVNVEELRKEIDGWKYPLHFIDFETATPAIPFNRGRRPYEGIAFQFSHHVVTQEGKVAHVGQHLDDRISTFPNYDFVRALRNELDTSPGTIFRYAEHENSILNMIGRQIVADRGNVPDHEELLGFINLITQSAKEKRAGGRNMVDLKNLVVRYYYDPRTRGSNSIKHVLPAILNSSEFLKDKYSKPVYGTEIRSLNFPEGKVWVEYDGDSVKDPYSLLPRLFGAEFIDLLSEDDEVKDGGAAMMAYARLQFEDMTDEERNEIRNGLLRYCELDTLAMVMVYEGWKDIVNR